MCKGGIPPVSQGSGKMDPKGSSGKTVQNLPGEAVNCAESAWMIVNRELRFCEDGGVGFDSEPLREWTNGIKSLPGNFALALKGRVTALDPMPISARRRKLASI